MLSSDGDLLSLDERNCSPPHGSLGRNTGDRAQSTRPERHQTSTRPLLSAFPLLLSPVVTVTEKQIHTDDTKEAEKLLNPNLCSDFCWELVNY